MSTYPLLAYQITIPEVTVTMTLDDVSDDIVVPAGTYWGWAVGGLADLSGTLAQAFGDAIATHSEWPSTPTVQTQYVSSDSTQHARPYWSIRFTGGGLVTGQDLKLISTTSELFERALGLVDNDSWEVGISGTVLAKRRWLGCWSPGSLASYPEPIYIDKGTSTRSDYDPSAHDRVRVGRSMLYVCEWDYVEAADISREIVEQAAGYMTLAEREAGDVYGTLDDLLGAAGSNSEIRLVISATESVDCILDAAGDLQRDRYTTEEGVGARRYRVTLPLLLASEYGGVQT